MADFLASLRLEQWDHPSLCRGWRIRDVAAHVVSYEEHGWADLIKRLARARFRPGRLNEVALADYAARDPQELVEFLRKHLTPRGGTARFGGRVGLVDALIHHQDMRRPLGMRRQIPAELGPYTDFELGMLNGKLSTLRWVLGSERDFLDT